MAHNDMGNLTPKSELREILRDTCETREKGTEINKVLTSASLHQDYGSSCLDAYHNIVLNINDLAVGNG